MGGVGEPEAVSCAALNLTRWLLLKLDTQRLPAESKSAKEGEVRSVLFVIVTAGVMGPEAAANCACDISCIAFPLSTIQRLTCESKVQPILTPKAAVLTNLLAGVGFGLIARFDSCPGLNFRILLLSVLTHTAPLGANARPVVLFRGAAALTSLTWCGAPLTVNPKGRISIRPPTVPAPCEGLASHKAGPCARAGDDPPPATSHNSANDAARNRRKADELRLWLIRVSE